MRSLNIIHKRGVIFIITFLFLFMGLTYADTRIFHPNFCNSTTGGYFNTTSGSAPSVTNNGGNDCYYTFLGTNAAVTNSSTVTFPTTDNSSWYCLFNFSISATFGRGINLINGSSGGAYGGTDTTLGAQVSAKNSCAGDNLGACIYYFTDTATQPRLRTTDTVTFFYYNVTYNMSNLTFKNLDGLGLTASVSRSKVYYIQNWRFGQPDDSPIPNMQVSKMDCYNVTIIPNEGIPPEIVSYNMTSEGGCTNWNISKNNACNTTDVTPSIYFITNEPAYCSIGTSDLNRTDLGASRVCDGGEETTQHSCDLKPQDELTYDVPFVYIGCSDLFMNENRTSTSGALKLNITSLESNAKNSIEAGIANALGTSYSTYNDQKIYARNSANNQSVGTFDKVAKKLNKIWAFNRIGMSDNYVNMFNITPVLHTLEFGNKTSAYITNQTSLLINATK